MCLQMKNANLNEHSKNVLKIHTKGSVFCNKFICRKQNNEKIGIYSIIISLELSFNGFYINFLNTFKMLIL